MTKPFGIRSAYRRLTLPQYEVTKDEPEAATLTRLDMLGKELCLGQRRIAILGIDKKISTPRIRSIITKNNRSLSAYKEKPLVESKLVPLADYNVVILYRDKLYLELLEETCRKQRQMKPVLWHYILTQLFGYSDDALHSFITKWLK